MQNITFTPNHFNVSRLITRTAIQPIRKAENEPQVEECQEIVEVLQASEALYLRQFGLKADCIERTEPERATLAAEVQLKQSSLARKVELGGASSVNAYLNSYAEERGVDLQSRPLLLLGQELGLNSKLSLQQCLRPTIEQLFHSKQTSLNGPEYKAVLDETDRYIDLVLEAKQAGELGSANSLDAFRLISRNLVALSVQDVASSECLLGDHGVRHLIEHNVAVCERLADQLEAAGHPLRAVDRLALHQAMILHDIGYAEPAVREAIASQGLKGQDAGHPLLSAHYFSDSFENANDPLTKMFKPAQRQALHRCALHHDVDSQGTPGLKLHLEGQLDESNRAEMLETLMRIADNSHAFDDKLPELLYSNPAFLKTFRYIQAAIESGDLGTADSLKAGLKNQLSSNLQFGDEERQAMARAVDQIDANQAKFAVQRIVGRSDEVAFKAGRFQMVVEQSPIHEPLSNLFGVEVGHQQKKSLKDLLGSDYIARGEKEFIAANGALEVVVTPAIGLSEFQMAIQQEVLEDASFNGWIVQDKQLATQINVLKSKGTEKQRHTLQVQRSQLLQQHLAAV